MTSPIDIYEIQLSAMNLRDLYLEAIAGEAEACKEWAGMDDAFQDSYAAKQASADYWNSKSKGVLAAVREQIESVKLKELGEKICSAFGISGKCAIEAASNPDMTILNIVFRQPKKFDIALAEAVIKTFITNNKIQEICKEDIGEPIWTFFKDYQENCISMGLYIPWQRPKAPSSPGQIQSISSPIPSSSFLT